MPDAQRTGIDQPAKSVNEAATAYSGVRLDTRGCCLAHAPRNAA